MLSPVNGVTVRLELQLDDAPQETSWEIRGPLPRPTLLDGVTYDYYAQRPNSLVEEVIDLEEGDYYFLLNDLHDDGIEHGSFQIIAELTTGPTVLATGSGDFSSGQIQEFTIPKDQPIEVQISGTGGYVRGSGALSRR
jgi:hypothetical protein